MKYQAFFQSLAASLGIWGVLVIATVDAAAFGIPMDPVMAYYVWRDPHRLALYCLMGAVGSAVGSLIPYWVGRGGGELLLLKRIDRHKLERLRDRFERQEFFFLMAPSMLPPPTPFKMIVLATGVFEMRVPLFLLAIFVGRMLRFLILSALVLRFGPEVVQLITKGAKQHGWAALLGVVLLAILVGIGGALMSKMKRTRAQS